MIRPESFRRTNSPGVRTMANTARKTEADILATVHRSVAGLHRAGVVDKATMREFDALRLTPVERHFTNLTELTNLTSRPTLKERERSPPWPPTKPLKQDHGVRCARSGAARRSSCATARLASSRSR